MTFGWITNDPAVSERMRDVERECERRKADIRGMRLPIAEHGRRMDEIKAWKVEAMHEAIGKALEESIVYLDGDHA